MFIRHSPLSASYVHVTLDSGPREGRRSHLVDVETEAHLPRVDGTGRGPVHRGGLGPSHGRRAWDAEARLLLRASGHRKGPSCGASGRGQRDTGQERSCGRDSPLEVLVLAGFRPTHFRSGHCLWGHFRRERIRWEHFWSGHFLQEHVRSGHFRPTHFRRSAGTPRCRAIPASPSASRPGSLGSEASVSRQERRVNAERGAAREMLPFGWKPAPSAQWTGSWVVSVSRV